MAGEVDLRDRRVLDKSSSLLSLLRRLSSMVLFTQVSKRPARVVPSTMGYSPDSPGD
jgi:hypothetical protein